MSQFPDDLSDPNEALEVSWADVESGEVARIAAAIAALPALIPVIVAEHGEASPAHRSALRALAYGLDEVGDRAASREMYGMLAEMIVELRRTDEYNDEAQDRSLLDEELYAQTLSALIGASDEQAKAALSFLDGLVARSESTLGPSHRRTLWLLSRRAQWMVRVLGVPGLEGFEVLVARAASIQEGGVEHLNALADQATELSRLDLDAESALLWERVVAGRRNVYGFEHSETLAAWWWQVRTHTWSGDIERADGELAQLIPALGRLLGEDDSETLTAMRFRVQLLRQLRSVAGSQASHEDPLKLAQQIQALETARFGPDSRAVFRTRNVSIDIAREQWDEGLDHRQLRREARELVIDAANEFGIFDELSIHARHTEQRLLRDVVDALGAMQESERNEAEPTDVAAEGMARAQEWRELVSQHCREILSAEPSDPDLLVTFLEEVRGAWLTEIGWRESGAHEQFRVLRAAVAEFAEIGVQGRSAEIQFRDLLARELLGAEQASESLVEYERVLELERESAASSDPPHDASNRIALSVQAVGAGLRRVGRTADAEAVLANAILDARSGKVDEQVIRDLRNARALALQELDRYDEAAAEMRALVESSENIGYVIDLAVVYLNAGRPIDAEQVLTPALVQLESAGEGRGVQAMRIMGNLALALCKLDQDAEAAAAYDRLCDLQVASIGPTHRDTLITQNNRALEELHLGRFVEATRRFEQVHQLRAEVLGERDPQTLSSLANLAQASQSAGDLHTSRGYSEQVLALSREVLGSHHPSTLTRARVLDRTLELMGSSADERAALAEELRSGFVGGTLSESDPHAAGNRALVYADHLAEQGRYVDALVEFARARDAFSADADLNWLRAERGIAASHLALGAFPEACESYARVVPQLERLLPHDRWALADALNDLSRSSARAGRTDEIEAPQRRAIEIADEEGSNPERTVLFRVWLGRRMAASERHEVALTAYENAVATGERLLGGDHKVTLDARDDVAEELVALGRTREALKIYRMNIPAMERAFGATSPQVSRAREKQHTAAQGVSKATAPWVFGVVAAAVVAIILWNELGG